jgi:hypothetical protein
MSTCRRRTGNARLPALRPRSCLVVLCAVALAVAVALPPHPLPTAFAQVQAPGAPGAPGYAPARPQVTAPVASVMASPMDEPLRLMAEARQTFQKVQDYTCTMIKQERVNGQLQPENVIAVKFRNQPFSVYMRWSAPRESVGQEVCFVHGRNNNMMRVHASGILGVAGFVSIDPRDPKVMQNSRHTIYEAGLGNLIDRISRAWEAEKQLGKTQTRIAEYEYAKRRVFRVETYYTERVAQAYCWRSVVFFDKETKLPIRTENYDWPRQGVPGGDLLETFSYIDLRFNIGLTDAAFNY